MNYYIYQSESYIDGEIKRYILVGIKGDEYIYKRFTGANCEEALPLSLVDVMRLLPRLTGAETSSWRKWKRIHSISWGFGIYERKGVK